MTMPAKLDALGHIIVAIVVVLSVTVLRGLHDLDNATVSTVYGAVVGAVFGVAAGRRSNENGRPAP